ncbi:MAG: hypothetical protein M3458_20185 [Acidobacteriota bacterium]|nr:hypothetical protein [Acidobacteriota bacterium]
MLGDTERERVLEALTGAFAFDDLAERADLDAEVDDATAGDFDGVAFLAGAFSPFERLAICFGRAEDATSLRPFAADFVETVSDEGRGEGFFTPLTTGSLMRCTQFS